MKAEDHVEKVRKMVHRARRSAAFLKTDDETHDEGFIMEECAYGLEKQGRALKDIIVRCDEGDPRCEDWLGIISRIAKDGLNVKVGCGGEHE